MFAIIRPQPAHSKKAAAYLRLFKRVPVEDVIHPETILDLHWLPLCWPRGRLIMNLSRLRRTNPTRLGH
jgi:hypothetical protein